MNILHINQSDTLGGAAIAGYRLHQGLLKQDINSHLLVGTSTINDSHIDRIGSYTLFDKLLLQITNRVGLNGTGFISSFQTTGHSFFQKADVLNFHNLHGYFNYLAIPKLTRDKPAVFTLHDMWTLTGHCTYSYDCTRWQNCCGQCPYPNVHPPIQRDNTHMEWKLKDWVYKRSNITVVAPSRWLAELARQSMLNRFPIYHIPYGLDLNVYQPLGKKQCRATLGIPGHKKILMFGAADIKDYRKGGDLLLKALRNLPSGLKSDTLLLTFGSKSEQFGTAASIPTLHLGYISSDHMKATAYSAADLFILPTRADNLPIVLQESMACGTPMVAFNVGGVSDLVRPEVTGYLAEPENDKALCEGIVQLLEDDQLREKMSQNCRSITVDQFSLELQVKKYVQIYQQVLEPSDNFILTTT
ncbi:MAG: glycosyltransferase family 4 protein [Anaerolineae bacterium]|nr:glycosyltransferase family 4 protein [Anaerolineae bacterium]